MIREEIKFRNCSYKNKLEKLIYTDMKKLIILLTIAFGSLFLSACSCQDETQDECCCQEVCLCEECLTCCQIAP